MKLLKKILHFIGMLIALFIMLATIPLVIISTMLKLIANSLMLGSISKSLTIVGDKKAMLKLLVDSIIQKKNITCTTITTIENSDEEKVTSTDISTINFKK